MDIDDVMNAEAVLALLWLTQCGEGRRGRGTTGTRWTGCTGRGDRRPQAQGQVGMAHRGGAGGEQAAILEIVRDGGVGAGGWLALMVSWTGCAGWRGRPACDVKSMVSAGISPILPHKASSLPERGAAWLRRPPL
jgi:hypothetical protein